MAMPVMSGVDATVAIRAAGVHGLPILAMTANASERDRGHCERAGMDGFLCKPVLKDQLAEAIAAVCAAAAEAAAADAADAAAAEAAAAAAASAGGPSGVGEFDAPPRRRSGGFAGAPPPPRGG